MISPPFPHHTVASLRTVRMTSRTPLLNKFPIKVPLGTGCDADTAAEWRTRALERKQSSRQRWY